MPCSRSLAVLIAALFILSCSTPRRETSKSRVETSPVPAAPQGEADARPIIVALGDSLTSGLGVDVEDNYPGRLQKKIEAGGYRYRVVNAGVSGDTTAQGLNRLQAVRELRPRIVIVALGANDGLRGLPAENTKSNLETIISELKSDGVKVILAGMLVPPNYGAEYSQSFSELFPEIARRFQVPLIPFLLEGVAGRPNLNQYDGIHPNSQGYAVVVENVWKALRPMLQK